MANSIKITGLDAVTNAANTDLLYIVTDPAGIPTSKKITVGNILKAANSVSLANAAYTNSVAYTDIAVANAVAYSVTFANTAANAAYTNAVAYTVNALNNFSSGVSLYQRFYDYASVEPHGSAGLGNQFGGLAEDDTQHQIALPFPVTFLGETYSSVWINSNSYLTFREVVDGATFYPLGPAFIGVPAISVGATDREMTAYYYDTVGTKFIIRYEGFNKSSGGDAQFPSRIWEVSFDSENPGIITLAVSGYNIQSPTGIWGIHDGVKWIDIFAPLPYVDQDTDILHNAVTIASTGSDTVTELKFVGTGVESYIEGNTGYVLVNPLQNILNASLNDDGDSVLSSAYYGLHIKSAAQSGIKIEPAGSLELTAGSATPSQPGDGFDVVITAGAGVSNGGTLYDGGNIILDPGANGGANDGIVLSRSMMQVNNNVTITDDANNFVMAMGQGMGPTIYSNASLFSYAFDGSNTEYTTYSGSVAYPNNYSIFVDYSDNANSQNSRNTSFNMDNSTQEVSVAGNTFSVDANGYVWSFNGNGGLTIPGNGTISVEGGLGNVAIKLTPSGANANQALLIYPTAAEGNHLHLTTVDPSTELYLGDDYHYVKLDATGNVTIVANDYVGNTAEWSFGTDGTILFPTRYVDIHNGGIQVGQVLQFGDSAQQIIITGPTPAAGQSAERIIIQGQRANGVLAEGGDVYLWGGDANTNGGDIKIYAGDADDVDAGYGGYVNIDGGSGFNQGGDVEITGGYSSAGQAGDVNIIGGYSSTGNDGNISLITNGHTWQFSSDNTLTLPTDSTVNNNLIPTANITYSLGNSSLRWEQLWIGSNSLIFADSNTSFPDQVLTVSDGIFNITQDGVASEAGLRVGNFTLVNNYILLANAEQEIVIGANNSTGPVIFNRPIDIVSGETGAITFAADRSGRVQLLPPVIPALDVGAFSIIGTSDGSYQGVTNPGGMLHITGNDGVGTRLTIDSFGDGSTAVPIIAGRAARGTANTPLNTQANDTLIRIAARGWNGADNFVIPSQPITPTLIEAQAIENFTNTAIGTQWSFYNAPIGSVTRTLSATINAIGIATNTVNSNTIVFTDGSVQNTAFNSANAVTKINVGTGLTQTANVGIVGIDSTAVLSITGTANQVIAANVGGNYTLSLPQNIGTNSIVQFNSLTVANLTVTGTTTTAATLSITDKVIHLAATSTAADQIDGGGFTLGNTDAAYHVSFLYDLANDRWDTNGGGLKTLDFDANTITGNSGFFAGALHAGNAYEDYDFTDATIQADGNNPGYSQVIAKNHSSSTEASTDFVATNDIGDDTVHYIDMGINSSTYSNADYSITGPSDGYLYVNGGDLAIGTQNSGNDIKLFTGNTTSDALRATVNTIGITVVSNVYATYFVGSLDGTANNTLYVGTIAAANVVSNSQLQSNLANYVTTTNLTNNLANYVTATNLSNNLANYVTATNLSNNLANYVTATNLSNNLASYALLSGASFTNNVSVANTLTISKISANGTLGSAGQLLTSNGTTTYWSTPAAGGVSSLDGANNIILSGSTGSITINRIDGSQVVTTGINTTPYTVLATDQYVGSIRSATSTSTITLPLGSGVTPGRQYIIKDEGGQSGSSLRRVTVAASGSDTIDGSATRGITSNYGALTVLWTGTRWSVI